MKRKVSFLSVITLTFAVLLIFAACNTQSDVCRCENNQENNTGDLSPSVYFSFDAKDANGNYYDEISGKAALSNGSLSESEGQSGKAVCFDGKSKIVYPGVLPSGNTAHTIIARIKTAVNDLAENGENVIAGWGEYSQLSDTRIMIYRKQFCVTSYGVFTVYPISDAMNSKWINFALTYDGNKFIMYINGVKTRVVTASNGIALKKSPLYIGGFANDALGFKGEIDALYVFDKCLNEREINKYMNDKGDFEVKKPENNIPLLDEDNIFNVKNCSETGWNDFVYAHGETKLNFAIRLPDGYDKTKKYPLVVFYHGDGSNGKTAESVYTGGEFTAVQRALQENGQFIALVPVATKPWLGVPNDVGTVYPYRIYDMDKEGKPGEELIAADNLTDVCMENLAVDESRVYLCGYSRGTMASWYLLSQSPDKFAAAVLCCGMGDPKITERFKKVPVWLFMGTDDPLVSYRDMKEIYDSYENNGGKGRFTACSGAGHDLSAWLFNQTDIVDWLFAQKK